MEQKYIELTVHRPGYAARKARRERIERRKRRVCGLLAGVSAFLLFGTVGSIERDMMALGTGSLYMALEMAATMLFIWLAGGFDDEE